MFDVAHIRKIGDPDIPNMPIFSRRSVEDSRKNVSQTMSAGKLTV